MTFEDFKDEIIVSLGGNLVDVELEDRDIKVAFNRAKRTYKQRGPDNARRRFLKLPVKKAIREYSLPSEIDTVIRIIQPSFGWDIESTDAFALQAFNDLFMNDGKVGSGDYLTYELELQLDETYRRYANFEIQFDYDKYTHKLRPLHAPRSDNMNWIIECYASLCDEEYMEMWWILEWSIAEAKEILGMAYRKFSSLPGPDGGSVSLNGEGMIQEAAQAKQGLLEAITNLESGDVDYYEITMG